LKLAKIRSKTLLSSTGFASFDRVCSSGELFDRGRVNHSFSLQARARSRKRTPLDTTKRQTGRALEIARRQRRAGGGARAPHGVQTTVLDQSINQNPHKATHGHKVTHGQGEADLSATSRIANPASRSDARLGAESPPRDNRG